MSWMSPFTVANATAPFSDRPAAGMSRRMVSNPARAASAEAMSWGRKYLPWSNRTPTSSRAGMKRSLMSSMASQVASSRSVASSISPLRPVRMSRRMGSASPASPPVSAPAAGAGAPPGAAFGEAPLYGSVQPP